jgi:tRNA nucleotidyltransferase (CCA-adding enzyme)
VQSVDAFRRPDRFEEFLLACEADFRGRTGFETLPYPQGDLLRRALAAAARIKPDTASGLPGVEVGERLRDERLEAVRAALDEVSR